MNKKLFLVIITGTILLLCSGKAGSITKTSKAIDYSQYIKKTWVVRNGTNNGSFCISKIVNGKVIGRFLSDMPAVPSYYDLQNLTGTINKNTAICQFSDTIGNKGSIKLLFEPNNQIEATIKLTYKTQTNKTQPKQGNFQFVPYSLNHIKGFSAIKKQSFMVNLNSWGNVKFVAGKLTGGNHIPTVFYLTNKYGNILYDFADTPFPYSVDVKAVSFVDVNKDGLKDIIIIVSDAYKDSTNFGAPIANVFIQNANGSFKTDSKLYQEINSSGNNKNIKTVTNYLLKKF